VSLPEPADTSTGGTLVFVYGPPAVGKLTVAKEISRLTGMKLFDNHATVNAVAPIFGFDNDIYYGLLRLMRSAIVEEAAKADIDLVSTAVYNFPRSDEGLAGLDGILAKCGGSLHLLRLVCDRNTLDERVTNDDRRLKQSINSVESLARYMEERDPDRPIPGRESLTIDNTKLSPTEVAEAAITHFGLSKAVPA
jgi:shikimate kinase